MAREKDDYREILASLHRRFPDKEMLTITDSADFIGCSYWSARRNLPFNPTTHRISKPTLARVLCS